MVWLSVLLAILFVVVAPVLGCLITGADRILTARMQRRRGPSILQPYYDVRKLLEKDARANDVIQVILLALSLVMLVVAGVCLYAGANFLLCILLETLSSLMFILAASVDPSPFVQVGVQREILQVMCCEPMLLLFAVGVYLYTGSFSVSSLFSTNLPMVIWLPLIFIGLVFVLTIKLRKSPFDIASSHHAHQEIVAGASTEMSGLSLALIEVTHWYELVILMSWVGMFFVTSNPLSILLAILAAAVVFLLEIWIDNSFARVKWQVMFKSSWMVALVCGMVNFAMFFFIDSNGLVFF
jgi:formate hydrogenlyase subunit 4